jgi:phosphocarrier protein FPr
MKLNTNVKSESAASSDLNLNLKFGSDTPIQEIVYGALTQVNFQNSQEKTQTEQIINIEEYQKVNIVDRIIIRSPISGVVIPIEQVPDPAFSQKIVGIGVAIDPTEEEITSPCNGTISQLHPSGHAIAILTSDKIEILIHIGIDTIKLKGEGFQKLVKNGMTVKIGQPLIRFNADLIARKAKSLLTEVVLTNQAQIKDFNMLANNEVSVNDPLFSIQLCADDILDKAPQQQKSGIKIKSSLIEIKNLSGIHARPAALLANFSKKFQSELFLVKGTRSANVRSLTSIMSLEVLQKDRVYLEAIGPDAAQAIEQLTQLFNKELIENEDPLEVESSKKNELEVVKIQKPGFYSGVTASPGYAVGRLFYLKNDIKLDSNLISEHGGSLEYETNLLNNAIDSAKLELQEIVNKLKKETDGKKALIFSAHQEIIDDPSIIDIARSLILNRKSAAFAWKTAFTDIITQMKSLNNQLLAARAMDVQDVGQRVLLHLVGSKNLPLVKYPDQCILVAEELTPSDIANIDRDKVLGIVTTTGGATSHVAILARSIEIPALVGVNPEILTIDNGILALLDATNGNLLLGPSYEELQKIESKKLKLAIKKQEELAHALEPAITKDGRRIEIVANLKASEEAITAIKQGAEGVGLLRTEFLFMNRHEAPSEQEQLEAYLTIAKVMGKNRPLIIRTLDVGGDKPLKYLPIQKEDNPFLGERGIRISLDRPEIFRTQLRAILRTADTTEVRVMFPMVSTLDEIKQAKVILEEERNKLNIKKIPIGIMVEVPSVAILAEHFIHEVDFFSIGSNDLSQYTLAIDRGHPKLASQVDGLDPSLLHLINNTITVAHKHGKWVGICGGIASDPEAVPILLGLNIDELSVSIPSIPSIKSQIRNMSHKDCEKYAQMALNLNSGAEIRSLFRSKE